MAEFEDTIEYLDEDEDLVQQYVKSQPHKYNRAVVKPSNSQSLLRPIQKRKRKEEVDSEYDPSDDNLQSPPSPPARKKKLNVRKLHTSQAQSLRPMVKENKFTLQNEYLNRKKLNIRIPDYDDPLCLPVRALKHDSYDMKRLNNWNKVCLEHFKHCDRMLRAEKGETQKSFRTVVFKNVVNNQTGNSETTVWSKTTVESKTGEKKSEIFQSVLPRYKEKKVLGNYILGNHRHHNHRVVDEVVLSKEEHKDGDVLVVYKPKEALSAVYKLVDKRKTMEDTAVNANETKMFMKETTCCKMCAPCFHNSWRGIPTEHNSPQSLTCPICTRTCVTVYNLLAHFKTHSSVQLRSYKTTIANILARIVGYHYKCRICRVQFDGIKALRKHLPEHQSKESFKCEVGNHYVKILN